MLDFAADDVEDESVARNLLVALDLDDVTSLDAAPVRDLEALVALREDELFDRLAIHFFSRLFQLLVVKEVKAASRNNRCDGDENHMGVVRRFTLPRDSLRAEVHQQDHVIELEDGLVEEDGQPPEALSSQTSQIIG